MGATASVRISQPGQWLGHYTTAAVAFEHILPGKSLRMSPYHLMRDPAENKDLVPGTAFWGGQENAEVSWLHSVDELKTIRDRVRLLSLTQDVTLNKDTKGAFGCCWAHPRTWEQYADAHRGVCLVFDRGVLEEALTATLRDKGPVHLGPVRYTRAGIADSELWHLTDQRIFDPTSRRQAVLNHVETHRDDLFFLKSDDWSTEHEFRVLLIDAEDEYVFAGYGEALRAVVVGEKFPEWQLAGASEICEQAGVELKKALWDRGRPLVVRAVRSKEKGEGC
jgi:Protein of unknown function (DUF2971)